MRIEDLSFDATSTLMHAVKNAIQVIPEKPLEDEKKRPAMKAYYDARRAKAVQTNQELGKLLVALTAHYYAKLPAVLAENEKHSAAMQLEIAKG